MTETINKVAKACAFVIFADGKIDQSEIDAAKKIFEKYQLDSTEGEKLIRKYLDDFIDASDDPKEEEADYNLGDLEIEGIDSSEVLKDLALIIVADNEISYPEVEIIHMLCEAFGLDPIFSSLAILNALKNKDSLSINLE
ncbi:TerB family tellurite resistance protein [Succinivibrio dextrinosolvens]|uniref:tellurite resistance TerB family protein n=1 Tax=Succinivibrio dextrinosolvens TaxID=83771 RepID=UPI002479E065|nr:TerB family tellurite resistance protein [Succinivibrio dextrinosolvens]MDY6415695.1 TerB family tellurite resistance protein [Succinivibrio dextrinosolvens]